MEGEKSINMDLFFLLGYCFACPAVSLLKLLQSPVWAVAA